MPELTAQQRWSYRVLASTMPVLRLLNDLARPASTAEIATILDITPKTAQRYLNNLESIDLIARLPESRAYYSIVELEQLLAPAPLAARQPEEILELAPALPATLVESPPEPESCQISAGIPPLQVEEKIFPPGEAVVVVESLSIKSIKNLTATTAPHRGKFFSHPGQPGAFPWLAEFQQAAGGLGVQAPGQSPPVNPTPDGPLPADPTQPPPIPEDIRQALVAAGISEPKRSQIARLPHITPAYVRNWSAYLETHGRARSSGLLVHLLEQGDPLPESAGKTGPDGEFHLKGCTCKFCTWGRLLCPDCLEYPCECETVCADCGEDPCICPEQEDFDLDSRPAEDDPERHASARPRPHPETRPEQSWRSEPSGRAAGAGSRPPPGGLPLPVGGQTW